MKLISDSHFDIREHFGNLILLYPEGKEELVTDLKARLDPSGHVYHCRAVGKSLLLKGDAFDEIISLLDRCACLVPIFDGSLVAKGEDAAQSNTVTRAMFWYFIGYLRAKLQDEAIVPYIPEKTKEAHEWLQGTPLQVAHAVYDPDVFMQKISEKFEKTLLRYNYYENKTTNYYASRRIDFHCLKVSFQIYEEAFQNALAYYSEITDRDHTEEEFDRYLESKLICGCRVVSFGSEARLTPQMMIYSDEIHPYIADYPRTLSGKKTYRLLSKEKQTQTGIRAELTADILIPVHKILGAYIKCYLACSDPESNVFMLLSLFEPDFTEGNISEYDDEALESAEQWTSRYPNDTFIDTELNRIYFSLRFETDEPPAAADPELRVGELLDYVYPQ